MLNLENPLDFMKYAASIEISAVPAPEFTNADEILDSFCSGSVKNWKISFTMVPLLYVAAKDCERENS